MTMAAVIMILTLQSSFTPYNGLGGGGGGAKGVSFSGYGLSYYDRVGKFAIN